MGVAEVRGVLRVQGLERVQGHLAVDAFDSREVEKGHVPIFIYALVALLALRALAVELLQPLDYHACLSRAVVSRDYERQILEQLLAVVDYLVFTIYLAESRVVVILGALHELFPYFFDAPEVLLFGHETVDVLDGFIVADHVLLFDILSVLLLDEVEVLLDEVQSRRLVRGLGCIHL